MRIYSGANGTVWAVARLGPPRNQIAALSDHALVVWDEGSADPVQTLPIPDHVRTHSGLSCCPTGAWLAGHYEGQLLVWRWSGGRWQAHSQVAVPALCVARFGADPVTVTAARVARGERGAEFQISRRSLGTRRSAPESIVARFDAQPSGLAHPDDLHDSHWWAADLSADAAWLLLSARAKAIHVWEVATGKHAGSVKLRGIPNEAKLAPDGSLFAVDCGTTVYVHRTRTQELVAAWKVKHCYVPQLAWAPDGRCLARADLTSAVRVFNVAGRHEAPPLGIPRQRAKSVAFSPDGSTYLVGTAKGSVVVWDLDD
jgi:WD40 repeat protein